MPDADTTAPAFVLQATSLTVDEGDSETFTVELDRAPAEDVTVTLTVGAFATAAPTTLTFTASNFDTAQIVTISGVEDDDAADDIGDLTLSADGLDDATVAITVNDLDTQSLIVTPTTLTVAENGTSTFTVALGAEPGADVTVTLTSSDSLLATAAPGTLTFNAANWDDPQTVTVAGVQDDDAANEDVTITAASAGVTSAEVDVTVTDDDTQQIVVSTTAVAVTEGGAAGTFTVRLQQQPQADRTVTLGLSGDTGAANVAPTSLTFTTANWNTPRTVTVTPVSDSDTADETLTITASSTGLTSQIVTATVDDDDVQSIVVTGSPVALAEGGTASFGVALAFDPQAQVTVTVSSSDGTAASVNTTSLTFDSSNYSVVQNVGLTGEQDNDLVSETVTITLATATAASATATVNVADNDSQALVVSTGTLSVNENGTGTFTVRLAFAPVGTVTVNVGSNNPAAATTTPETLTFNVGNYSVPQTVTVAGVQDADLINGTATIALSSTGLTTANVGVTVVEDDVQNIQLNQSTLTLTEGSVSGSVTARLAFDPGGTVVVTVASSDEGAATASPATLTFNSGNYTTPQTVTVAPIGDNDTANESVTVSFTAADINTQNLTVTVNDDDVQSFIVTPDNATGTPDVTVTEQGATGTFTVRLSFNPVTSVTVAVTSPDVGAVSVSPTTLTFNSTNYATPQTVTVAGVTDPDLIDEDVQVAITGAGAVAKSVHVRVVEDDLQDIIVSTNALTVVEDVGPGTFTVRLAYQPSGTVGLNVASADTGRATASPATLLFTTTNYATPQTVTVSGTTDANLHDTSTTVTVSSPSLFSEVIAVTVDDDDTQRILFSADTVSMDEADTVTVTARLAFIPFCEAASPGCTETVTVTSSDDDELTAAPGSLAFTAANYATPQTVTLVSIADADVLNENVDVTFDSNAAGTATRAVAVQVLDDDIQNFAFDPGSVIALLEGAGEGQIGVRLTQDPTTNLVVTVASADGTTLTVNGGASAQLTFTSANYATVQWVDVEAIQDVDLRDENINVTFAATGVSTATRTISVVDDDRQGIVAAAAAEVNEGGTLPVSVALAFQPTDPVTVNVNRAAGEDKYGASPTSLTFTSADWNVAQTVTLSGIADADLDDHSRTLTLTTEPAIPAGDDDGAEWDIAVTVRDNDRQAVVITTDPVAPFPVNVQEGGPVNSFEVALEFPPRDAIPDVVELTSNNPELEYSVDGGASWGSTRTLTFTTGDFSTSQVVWVRGLDDYDNPQAPEAEVSDVVTAMLDIPTEVSPPGGPGFTAATQTVTIIDDEITIIDSATHVALDGATRHTKRQNVTWANTVAVVTAYDVNGNTVVASFPRDNLDGLAVGATLGSRGNASEPVESVEWLENDGATQLRDVGAFATANGTSIVYARYQETLGTAVVSPVTVATNAAEFWPTYDGSQFGLLWRDSVDSNLKFRTVSLSGTTGTVRTVTAPTGSAHQKPNLHPVSGGGWIAIYTTAAEVRCVRLGASGSEIPGSNVALAGLPAGVFVQSLYNEDLNRVIAAYNNPTRGLSVAVVDPADCSVDQVTVARPFQNGTLLNTPFVAYNGLEYKLVYDQVDGTVGVVTMDAQFRAYDDLLIGSGTSPSIAWAGDRWIARYAGSVELLSGSFQTHCGDGVQNVDEDDVDCGGSSCTACVEEYVFVDTAADQLSGPELYEFLTGVSFDVTSSDYIMVEATGNVPNPGAWCSTSADFYVENYLTHAPGGGTSIASGPWDKWYRQGNGAWTQTNAAHTNFYSTACGSGQFNWCSEFVIGNVLAIAYLPNVWSCELYAGTNGGDGCNVGTATFRLRVGKTRETTCGF